MENEIKYLYLDDIIPNRFQPRENFDEQALKELAVSIKEHGVIQPIGVRQIGEKYEIVKDFTTNIYYTSLDKIKEAIGEEDYNKIKEIKDSAKEKISDGIEDAKQYIIKKYEDFRN